VWWSVLPDLSFFLPDPFSIVSVMGGAVVGAAAGFSRWW
jgi:hypothetical protein